MRDSRLCASSLCSEKGAGVPGSHFGRREPPGHDVNTRVTGVVTCLARRLDTLHRHELVETCVLPWAGQLRSRPARRRRPGPAEPLQRGLAGMAIII